MSTAEPIRLRLYIAGETQRSRQAIENLQRICDNDLDEEVSVEIVDLSKEPERAAADQIVALPTLIKDIPPPIRRIIGDLSNVDKVLVGLNLSRGNGHGR